MNRKIVVYVAGKFTGAHAWEVAENIRAAERVGYAVAELGAAPLIPHANTASFDGTFSQEFWLDATAELLLRSDALITVGNWRKSAGATAEVKLATLHQIPVFHEIEALRDALADWLEPRAL